MTEYSRHGLSAIFPTMTDMEFAELRADIAANGLRHPILLFEGQVLDGWHRYTACQQIGVAPRFVDFDGDEDHATRAVISDNLARRQLNVSQRAMIAARLLEYQSGRPKKVGKITDLSATTDQIAQSINVSTKTMGDARVVLTGAAPETITQVESGEVSISKAAKEVRASRPKTAPKPKSKPAMPTLVPQVEIEPQTVAQWNKLSAVARHAHLAHRNPTAKLNQQSSGEDDNAIDWAKWTWNPVTGCNHSCPYCYARDIAERFAGEPGFPNGFVPTLRADRLAAPLNGIPRASDDARERRIFTGSMTDLFGRWVPAEWIEAVLGVARQASQWEFLMLTKFPKRMAEFDIPPNVWMGTSVDCQARVDAAEAAFAKVNAKVRWLSCEPLIEPLTFKHLDRFDLLVIGGASRSSKTPQWIPPYQWLDGLMRQADAAKCNVFLKSNLYLKEQPGAARYQFADRAPEVFHYLARASKPDEQVSAA